ncbi:MAG: type II toxin-antitoxin system PemK/MazF family toxin [Dehalococcoidia bacterium]
MAATPERGDVVTVPFPFTELTAAKIRPALVLGGWRRDVTLAFLTTQPTDDPYAVLLRPGTPEFQATGLRAASTVRLSRLVTVNVSTILRRLGTAGPMIMADVNTALRAYLSL